MSAGPSQITLCIFKEHPLQPRDALEDRGEGKAGCFPLLCAHGAFPPLQRKKNEAKSPG